jgi:predicted DNA-binding protein (UPF0278 family)
MTWLERYEERSFQSYQKILDLPPAAKFILYILEIKQCMNRGDIIKETLLPKRTVGSALTVLLEENFIRKVEGDELKQLDCNYRKKIDYRQVYYQLKH